MGMGGATWSVADGNDNESYDAENHNIGDYDDPWR